MINKFKIGLAIVLAAIGFGVGDSSGDLAGQKVHPTGNNPHHYFSSTLTNLVRNVSDIPQKMATGTLQDGFRIAYDFRQSGIDFSDTNRFSISFFDDKGNRYGTGRFSTQGTGFMNFYVNGTSLNNPTQSLATNSSMHAVVCDGDWAYGLENDLDYNARGGINKTLSYTNSTLGKVIGSKEPLQISNFRAGYFRWNCFDGVTYDLLSSTNLTEKMNVEGSVTTRNNGYQACVFDYPDKQRFFKVKARIQE